MYHNGKYIKSSYGNILLPSEALSVRGGTYGGLSPIGGPTRQGGPPYWTLPLRFQPTAGEKVHPPADIIYNTLMNVQKGLGQYYPNP